LASLADGGLSLAITLLETASAVDESAVPAVPEMPQSLVESDWND